MRGNCDKATKRFGTSLTLASRRKILSRGRLPQSSLAMAQYNQDFFSGDLDFNMPTPLPSSSLEEQVSYHAQ